MTLGLNVFQLLVVPLMAALCAASIAKAVTGKHRRVAALAAAVWLAGGVTVLRPETTIRAAKWMGIGRGTDLVLYLFVIAFLLAAFYFYQRTVQLESAVTTLVRHLALRDAAPAYENAAPPRGPLPFPIADREN